MWRRFVRVLQSDGRGEVADRIDRVGREGSAIAVDGKLGRAGCGRMRGRSRSGWRWRRVIMRCRRRSLGRHYRRCEVDRLIGSARLYCARRWLRRSITESAGEGWRRLRLRVVREMRLVLLATRLPNLLP